MNLVLNIVLPLICVGVTYSSPTSNSSSDAADLIVTKTPPDHNKQILPVTQASQTIPPAVSTIASPSVKVDEPSVAAENKTKLPPVISYKNVTNEANKTSAITEATPKQITTSGNISTPPSSEKTISTQRSTITTTAKTSSSTAAPIASISDQAVPTPTAQERQFDGPSFVGGIVLTVGLTAIGFIAFKFYKSGKIERNYRTL